jgi:hypothetical protein
MIQSDIQNHKLDVAKPHESPHHAIPLTTVSTRRTGLRNVVVRGGSAETPWLCVG